MAKTSIGQFIAALRKANGMTQQDIADRLHISNKAVSRWERDECAPDISLIPALAELLGVTCDELLKGERILEADTAERKEQKVDRQVRSLINRALSEFKTFIWIALATAVMGLILMFGIAYGFYRPVIGFFVMLLFETCSLVLTVLSVSRARDAKANNEIFELAGAAQRSRFDNTLGNLSFWAAYTVLLSVLLSLPFVLVTSEYTNSVMTASTYFTVFFPCIGLLLALVYLKCKGLYMAWIKTGDLPAKEKNATSKALTQMNFFQLGFTVLAGVLSVLTPYFDTPTDGFTAGYLILWGMVIASWLASIVCFLVMAAAKKEERKSCLIPGIRNLCLLPSVIIVSFMHTVSWSNFSGMINGQPSSSITYTRYDVWYPQYLFYTIAYCLLVSLVFSLIETVILRKRNTQAEAGKQK